MVAFEIDGHTHRVMPLVERESDRLYLLFTDPTNRDETYGGGRFLYSPMPEGGVVTLDFNQAFNPPCALTPYATCPLPPAENHLSVRIEAGEKRPRGT
jgi:uncharacterized protein (DUF1684 family)